MRKAGIAAACIAAWLIASFAPAFALSNAAAAGIETVTVTGAHLPEAVGQAAFSVVQLDQAQLDSFDQLDAALEQVPGLSLYRRTISLSANPSAQGVSLRAIAPSATSRALVLLDGVPLNDPFGGWVIWSALPTEDIGGAEIIRGAGSGPYGASALTGTILLRERDSVGGISQADVSGGSLDTFRAGASGGTQIGPVDLFASGSAEHSNGWIPVGPSVRGPADNHVRLDSGSASLRADTQLGDDISATARLGYYDELQGAGLVGAEATAQGETASVALARAAQPDRIGWRLQSWVIDSNFTNISVSTGANQSSTTPADDQYSTPALGWGFNTAALGEIGNFHWEAGGDLRDDSGESHEFYSYSASLKRLLDFRRSGGRMIVGGLYGEGALDLGPWLLTLGARADYWATSQGHLVQGVRSSGAVTLGQDYAGRDGAVPTGRAGVRRNFDDGEFLRVAAYAGFRPPTLNEMYRPFRVGNVVTNGNAALVPEKLDGVEVGWGRETGAFSWNTTGFWNQLHDAVENVTLATTATCPPGTGTGDCQQKQNVGVIDAVGLEAEAAEKLTDDLALHGALAWTDARVHPGAGAPFLAGKRPAEAPTATITAGALWQPFERLTLDADLRWVSAQFDNDLNTIKLGSAFTLDLRAAWLVADGVSLFGKIDNVTDANVATADTTGVFNVAAPRTFEIGLTYAE
ncbi:MAG: TonB-dependent receptor [Rhizomicrobium sp.]